MDFHDRKNWNYVCFFWWLVFLLKFFWKIRNKFEWIIITILFLFSKSYSDINFWQYQTTSRSRVWLQALQELCFFVAENKWIFWIYVRCEKTRQRGRCHSCWSSEGCLRVLKIVRADHICYLVFPEWSLQYFSLLSFCKHLWTTRSHYRKSRSNFDKDKMSWP